MARVIFHIDLNAFYANAEIILNPSLKGKPIAVSGTTRRSVISTCSYEARAYGIHSAMPTQEALKLCKDLIIVSGHYEFYEDLSNKFIKIVNKYSNLVEKASIDECYVDVTDIIMTYKRPLDFAWQLQQEIYNEINIPCSIGVAPNKFLAKMASDMKKPMGITVLRLQEVPSKLWPLNIEKMRGVGKKTVPLLKELGINTIGDLANFKEKHLLIPIFKNNLEKILLRAHGKDDSEIIIDHEVKSISQSVTLLEDIVDYDEIKGVFMSLSRSLERRLKDEGKIGYVLYITIKLFDFNQIVRSKKLDSPIYNKNDIFEHTMQLFDLNWNDEPIRLLGIGLSKLIDAREHMPQLNLFETNVYDETEEVLNSLNKMIVNGNLKRASDILKKKDKL
ncbi:MAG: DNA polymerase IV [Erysipelotrichaceae bacterium]|jgi:DNA polymerase-4|nr:DNA polymerase IV [Bacillota bacterium]